ncbi:MAG: chemotaxis protein CheD [Bdellovibrionales bacterium RIFOXYD12_FULL_39_22]|nr:MAG: chemotaxis protein CheD [Bdellovibrionales bacterium RIFOXYB1_FULL_39_21]OFZ43480.1 MAG: chemotaxis protein CheD [Bdellovibrionales bacterium RIFOXYC12_FULL_39_17]OFZ47023.1 MAG: chemotaxis protein CheD [Bdellovibrionales bacterium RIFOXYC1_FULL_39_130]OFZ71301.1 MAG: chemotaxis protein CheD [Bdellovibrionales bacterium RIFOXYC2_FULL_39_8]OFZ76220.1 MAG: chemotaxis protein CheD [Bdellovibrionales bacterium RIFOXYD1_FULL_39_84]OFZ94455.1 MAG: chemotaxis protein CheD [Bdellovibrionales b
MKFEGRPTRSVGISEMIVSDEPNDVLVTYSLGSCLGIVMYDPIVKVGGLIHCMLPVSKDVADGESRPFMFVATGLVAMLDELYKKGAVKKNVICKIAGGGSPLNDNSFFRIGERNIAIARKILWKNNIIISGEDVGGTSARTLFFDLSDGTIIVRLDGQNEKML